MLSTWCAASHSQEPAALSYPPQPAPRTKGCITLATLDLTLPGGPGLSRFTRCSAKDALTFYHAGGLTGSNIAFTASSTGLWNMQYEKPRSSSFALSVETS